VAIDLRLAPGDSQHEHTLNYGFAVGARVRRCATAWHDRNCEPEIRTCGPPSRSNMESSPGSRTEIHPAPFRRSCGRGAGCVRWSHRSRARAAFEGNSLGTTANRPRTHPDHQHPLAVWRDLGTMSHAGFSRRQPNISFGVAILHRRNNRHVPALPDFGKKAGAADRSKLDRKRSATSDVAPPHVGTIQVSQCPGTV
jgi:hypothetical protein